MSEQSKKGPGRPKKQIATIEHPLCGIVDTPTSPEHKLELVCYQPLMFKKIFGLQKAFEVSEVEMIFTPTQIQINTIDHLRKSDIRVIIEGKYMNRYYCKETIKICIKRDNLEKALGTLGKTHAKITFLLRENYRSTLYCILKETEYNMDEQYEIDAVISNQMNRLYVEHDNYPLRFKLSSKHFKQKIGSIKKLSNDFRIEKQGVEPLEFNFEENQGVKLISSYKDQDMIELKSTLCATDRFSISICIDYIKPFSNSCIGDDVYIAADRVHPISMTSYLNKQANDEYTCSINVLTEISNNL
jgi:hypothetical protein